MVEALETAAASQGVKLISDGINYFYAACLDPIGVMQSKLKHGWTPSSSDFSRYKGTTPTFSWAKLRNGTPLILDNSPEDVFNVLQRNSSLELWLLTINEVPPRHTTTGCTLFHTVCRSQLSESDKLAVIDKLVAQGHSPLTPSFTNEKAVSLATEASVRASLGRCMEWQPVAGRQWWWGPCFRQRARAALLVMNRLNGGWRAAGKAGLLFARDVRHEIIRHVARGEHVYVESSEK